jgi:hypothetical protein
MTAVVKVKSSPLTEKQWVKGVPQQLCGVESKIKRIVKGANMQPKDAVYSLIEAGASISLLAF